MNFTGERYVPELRGQISYEHLHRYALALPLARDKDVLDIASGEGYGAGFLAMVARSVVGVDADDASISYSAARYTSMNLRFMKGSAAQIPLADSSVDVVVSFETIEHLVEQERMLNEVRRVLREDGHIIISSPNKLIYSDARNYHNPFHVRELYFHEFRDLLRAYFPEVQIFGQRIFAGSAVHPLGGVSPESRWLGPSTEALPGIATLPNPEYFIAVCACQEGGDGLNLSSIYLDPRDDLLNDILSGGLASATLTSNSIEPSRQALSGSATPALANGATTNALTAAPVSRQTELGRLRAELEQLRAELEETREKARTATREAAETRLIRESFDEELGELRDQLRDQGSAYLSMLTVVTTLRSALVASKATNDASESLLREMLASRSWKLLMLARKISGKLRSIRSRFQKR